MVLRCRSWDPTTFARAPGSRSGVRTASRSTPAPAAARIQRLAVPPAWTDVWICASPNGHLQATGRAPRGPQAIPIPPGFSSTPQTAVKFEALVEFGHALAPIRGQVNTDLELPAIPKAKVTALVVRLLEETLVRVGNEEYARANGSYGLTTLRDRHAAFTPAGLRLAFRSKHGHRTDVIVSDRKLRSIVRRCQESLPANLSSNISATTTNLIRSRPPT